MKSTLLQDSSSVGLVLACLLFLSPASPLLQATMLIDWVRVSALPAAGDQASAPPPAADQNPSPVGINIVYHALTH
jgi:hypothetical protein